MMSHTLPIDSPRSHLAREFGRELRVAMGVRRVGQRHLGEAVGVGRTMVCHYLKGTCLPRIATADLVAATLAWPRLAQICREARTLQCLTCGGDFLNDSGGPGRYCSERCHRVKVKQRVGVSVEKRADVAERRLNDAVAELELVSLSVAEMCRSCEPEGICHQPSCPLRPVSPLPTVLEANIGRPSPAQSRGTGWKRNKDTRVAEHSRRMRLRWDSERARERQGAASKAWWAALDPQQREEQIDKIRAGKRGAA